jgi:hypothetical protein
MDEILCPSTQTETNLIISEESDDELLPINYYINKTIKSNEDKCVLVNDNSIVNSFTTIKLKNDSNPRLSECPEDISITNEEKSLLKSQSISIDYNKSTKRTTYYSECPVCDSFGPKSLNHIKQCANKRSIDPKKIINLLKGIKKSNVSTDIQKPKTLKPTKKSNKKLINNYVIDFEAQKPLKLSVNPHLVCNKKSLNNPKNYELTLLDIKERQILLETKISDQIISNVVNNFAIQENIDKVLPNLWILSSLQSQINDYILEDFKKYDCIK